MCNPIADAGVPKSLARLSYLVLFSLTSCARADPPEEFFADPFMQGDYAPNLPSTGTTDGFTYRIIQGIAIFEGDIVLGRVDHNGQLKTRLRGRGVGKSDAFNRWPDGIVVYEEPTDNTPIQQENIAEAIAHWTNLTTLSFVVRTEENADQYPHYIQFQNTSSCASHVGMIGGAQPIYISDACSVGSVIHEIGHAVGLFHEHTRQDRDNFVQIVQSEIVAGKDINFEIQTANVATYSDYDYGSIMHYGENFFSKSGNPTILVANNIEIGQRVALSTLDVESVNEMYKTDLALGQPSVNKTGDGLEIDLTAYNLGNLGAHQLQLLIKLADDAEWKGVSQDSGWDCLSFGPELKCTRDTMREQTESRFTVLSGSETGTADDISILLTSRTMDPNLQNNGMNDDDVQWQSLESDPKSLGDNGDQPGTLSGKNLVETESQSSPPPLAAANQSDGAQSGGGSVGGSLIALLFTLISNRRRNRRRA